MRCDIYCTRIVYVLNCFLFVDKESAQNRIGCKNFTQYFTDTTHTHIYIIYVFTKYYLVHFLRIQIIDTTYIYNIYLYFKDISFINKCLEKSSCSERLYTKGTNTILFLQRVRTHTRNTSTRTRRSERST